MKKSIYSLPALAAACQAANRRYLEFLSALEDPRAGVDKLEKISQTVSHYDRSYPGFNLFDEQDQLLLQALARGEYNIRGLQNRSWRPHLPGKNSGQVSRLLKRLRVHGLLKKVGRTYRYYLTQLGKEIIITGLKLKELFLIPQLAFKPR